MEGLKKPLSRALSLALMMAMAFFGMLAITQAVYAEPQDQEPTGAGSITFDAPEVLYSSGMYSGDIEITYPEDDGYTYKPELQIHAPSMEDAWGPIPFGDSGFADGKLCLDTDAIRESLKSIGYPDENGYPSIRFELRIEWTSKQDDTQKGYCDLQNVAEPGCLAGTIPFYEAYATINDDTELDLLMGGEPTAVTGVTYFNSTHPEGDWLEATDVSAKNEDLVEVTEPEDENGSWLCTAKALGTTELEVTTGEDNDAMAFSFPVTVTGIEFDAENAWLFASGDRKYHLAFGAPGDDYEYNIEIGLYDGEDFEAFGETEYSYDAENDELTLHADAIRDRLEGWMDEDGIADIFYKFSIDNMK